MVSSPRAPLAFLVAAIAIVALEVFLHVNRYRLVDGIQANLMAKAAQLSSAGAPPDEIAIFGDSKLFSVRPSAVATAVSPGKAIRVSNYAWPFFGIEAYELMLETYLQNRPAPRAIILNGCPELIGTPAARVSLAHEPAHRQRAFTALPLRQIIALALRQRTPSLLWHRIVYALIPPSALYKETTPEALKDILRGRSWPLSEDYIRMTTSYRETGAFLMHRNRQITIEDVRAAEQYLGPFGIHQNHQQAASFERFLQRAARADINLYLLGSPAPPPYADRFHQLGINQAYRAVLHHWQQKFKNLHVVEPLFPVQPLHHFGDPGHLNTEGDTQFQATYPQLLAEAMRTGW